MRPFIKVDDLTVEVSGRMLASGVTFDLQPAALVWVRGRNGSGKTTLIRQLLGLAAIRRGSVQRRATGWTGRVGYVAQSVDREILPWFSAEENVAIGRACFGNEIADPLKLGDLAKSFFPDFSGHLSERFHLGMSADVRSLSGGERRKLVILRVLTTAPQVLILDEPFQDLDVDATSALCDYLASWTAGGVLLVSHHAVQLTATQYIDLS